MSIAENLKIIRSGLPEDVTLVAVSKTKPVRDIMEAYQAGQLHFGENKVQELVEKQPELPGDIKWHMIGHLQRNKVKYIAPFVHLIHAVDSLRLLKEIDKQAGKHGRKINCLIQVKIASEESKFGMPPEEVENLLGSEEFRSLKNITISGLMGMATFTDDKDQLRSEFKLLKTLFDHLVEAGHDNCNFKILSMGMSGDYEIAVEMGSNMVRIGSSIFGARNY